MTDANSDDLALSGLEQLGSQQHYANVIDGIYGTFATPAGRVCYLQTKARLSNDGTNHSKLTKALVPAREALNVKEMDFNQLLQRDLDDHRIATALIPYILDTPASPLPGFYPPIVSVILPFNAEQQPLEYFEPPKREFSVDPFYNNMRFEMLSYGSACRIQYLVDEKNQRVTLPLGVIRWNPDAAKMVIMDGQHRAMSLIAIERTINNSWKFAQSGEKYQPFYEEHVKRLIKKAQAEGRKIDLDHVELPVTVCWFPEEPGQFPRPRPHTAARKIFVDVNNTAKQPSASRLVLLSDTELQNIFARELLNRLKAGHWDETFPLYGVEYDNPKEAMTWPRRWSAVTNLEILKVAVIRAVFGPPKLYQSMSASLIGKPAIREMDDMMRQSIRVGDLFPQHFDDGNRPMERDEIGNETFPIEDRELHKRLLEQFYELWGNGILRLISEVLPYQSHLGALRKRYVQWIAADNYQTLARDALYEGVGLYWTLHDGHVLWESQCKEARKLGLEEPPQPDVSKAWRILDDQQQAAFYDLRATTYLGVSEVKTEFRADVDILFKGLRTYAAEIGLVMAWVTLQRRAAVTATTPTTMAEAMTAAINQVLKSGPTNARDRRMILAKTSSDSGFKPLNMLPKLEPALAAHFRYLWLELALATEGRALLENAGVRLEDADRLVLDARRAYLELLIKIRRGERKKDADLRDRSVTEQNRLAGQRATDEIKEAQAEAHKYWFGGSIQEARVKIAVTLNSVEPIHEVEEDEGNENGLKGDSDIDNNDLVDIVEGDDDPEAEPKSQHPQI